MDNGFNNVNQTNEQQNNVAYGVPVGQTVPPQQYFSQPVVPPEPQKPVYEKLDTKLLKSCRHKAEKRWYRRMVFLNIVIIAVIIGWFVYTLDDNVKYAQNISNEAAIAAESYQNGEEYDNTKLGELTEDVPQQIYYALFILVNIVALPFAVSYFYAEYRSMSVQITEKTYPEIYAIVEEYAQKLGMKKVPKVYMIQGNGVLNAFSSFIPFKQYIEIYADLLEVGYREHHDMDTIRFIIGHEMAHIYYKHATMHYEYGMLFSSIIPILSQTASRTREYSCDRLAQLLSGSDGVDAMMSLTAGIHLYKQVDKADYIEHASKVKGLFVFCYNLMCDHPIITKRVLALVDPQKKSGKLY